MARALTRFLKRLDGRVSGASSFAGLEIQVFASIEGSSRQIGRVDVGLDGKFKLKFSRKYTSYRGRLDVRLVDVNGDADNFFSSEGLGVDLDQTLEISARAAKRVLADFSVSMPANTKQVVANEAPVPAARLLEQLPSTPAPQGRLPSAPVPQSGVSAGVLLPPVGPTTAAAVREVLDNFGMIQGRIASLGATDDTSLVVSGRLEAGSLGPGEVVRVFDGSVDLGVATVSGNAWEFVDPRALSNGQVVNYNARVVGTNGSLSDPLNTYSVTVDLLPPVVQIFVESLSLGEGQTSLVFFELSEPSVTFDLGSITVSGGKLSAFTGSGARYQALFTADGSGLAAIAVDAGMFSDRVGNPNDASQLTSFASAGPDVVIFIDGATAFRDLNNNGVADVNEEQVALVDVSSFANWLAGIGVDFAAQSVEVRFGGVPSFPVDLSGFDVGDRIVVDLSRKPWSGVNLLSMPQVLQVRTADPLAPNGLSTATVVAGAPTGWRRFSSASASAKTIGIELWQRPLTQPTTATSHVNRLLIGHQWQGTTNGSLIFSASLAASTRHVVRNGISRNRGSTGVMAVLGPAANISYVLPLI